MDPLHRPEKSTCWVALTFFLFDCALRHSCYSLGRSGRSEGVKVRRAGVVDLLERDRIFGVSQSSPMYGPSRSNIATWTV